MGAFRDFIENVGDSPTEELPSQTPAAGMKVPTAPPVKSTPEEPYAIRRLEVGVQRAMTDSSNLHKMLNAVKERIRQLEIKFMQFQGKSPDALDDPAHIFGPQS